MATVSTLVLGFRSAHDLGALKALKAGGKLTSREVQRIEPVLKAGAATLPEPERRKVIRLGQKVAKLPDPEQHRFRDEFVRAYR